MLSVPVIILAAVLATRPAAPPEVGVSAAWSVPRAHPGDQRALALVLDIPVGLHVNPDAGQIPQALEFLKPLLVTVAGAAPGITLGPVQNPRGREIEVRYTGKPERLAVLTGKAVIYVPVVVGSRVAPGRYDLTVDVELQACDNTTCYRPAKQHLTATLEVVAPSQDCGPADTALFQQFDPAVFARLYDVKFDFFGLGFAIDAQGISGTLLILLIAMTAGLIMNFTPCVLPVMPLKIMSLHQHAGNPQRSLWLGLAFSAGVVVCFIGLGTLVAGLTGLGQFEWGQFLSKPWVAIGLAVVMAAMALGMFDLFTIPLPRGVYALNPSGDSAAGNFLLGVLTAVLSTPCTGPMLGATIAWAVKQGPGKGLLTFGFMGIGMALPYLVLAARPQWLSRLPRAGPGSVLMKQVMGFLMLGVAVFFLGPLIPAAIQWWAITGVIVAAMAWMAWRGVIIIKKPARRAAVILPAVAVSLLAVLAAMRLTERGPIPWQPFTPAALTQALAQKHPVLLEFTADWCGNCKALELTVYRDAQLAALFKDGQAVALRGDLTRENNLDGWAKQKELGGGGGIPLAAVYLPGTAEKPTVFQGLFTAEQLIEAMKGKQ